MNIFFAGIVCASENHEIRLWPEDVIFLQNKNVGIIIVEKETQKLFFLKKNGEHNFDKLLEVDCSTGKKQGDKNIEGDAKTPEGIYYVNGYFPGKYLSAVYGSRAFTLDYPNFMDKIAGKNGHNIWIHGTDKEPLEERTTNGCVALANGDIDKLKGLVEIGETPVIIAKKMNFSEEKNFLPGLKKSLFDFLNSWAATIEKGTYHDYLSFYSDRYLPEMGWWSDWLQLREKMRGIAVNYSCLKIFRESENVYSLWFDFFLELNGEVVQAGKRKLFIRDGKKGLRIFGDEGLKSSANVALAAEKIRNKVFFEESVEKFIEKWRKAWSEMDMGTYSNLYSVNFHSEGKNKKQWVDHKKRLCKKYKYIKITIENFKITKKNKNMEAVFSQIYESNSFRAFGTKTLLLKQESGKWKILKEIWEEDS